MRRLAAAVALVVASVAVAPSAKAETAHPARVLPESLGVNAQFLTNVVAVTTPAQREAAAAEIARQGIQVVRTLASWRDVERDPPNPISGHTYDWSSIDAYMLTLATRGLRAAPIVGHTPRWDSAIGPVDEFNNLGSGNWVPLHPEYFGAFVGAFVGRYGPGGTFWTSHPGLVARPTLTIEVGNEPNINGYFRNAAGGSCPFHQVGLDQGPKHYADYYAAAYDAAHAADPDAVVMVGGLSGWTVPVGDDRCTVQEFLAGMKVHRPSLVVDAIGMHVYRTTADDVRNQLVEIRRKIDELGWTVDLPFYFNESGWNAFPSALEGAVPDAQRGAWISQTADTALRSNCGVRQYMVHTWLTQEENTTDAEDWFGIGNLDGTSKTSANAFGATVRQLQGEGTTPANPATERLCSWRGDPDIDGDGLIDSEDAYPADATRGELAPVVPEAPTPVVLLVAGMAVTIAFVRRGRRRAHLAVGAANRPE